MAEIGIAGARCNGTSISATAETDLLSVLVAYGIDSHLEAPQTTRQEMDLLEEIVLSARNLRSANSAFDQMMVARGADFTWCTAASALHEQLQRIINRR